MEPLRRTAWSRRVSCGRFSEPCDSIFVSRHANRRGSAMTGHDWPSRWPSRSPSSSSDRPQHTSRPLPAAWDSRSDGRWPKYSLGSRGTSCLGWCVAQAAHRRNCWSTQPSYSASPLTCGMCACRDDGYGARCARATVILISREAQQLKSATGTRDRFGQAKKIIMERFIVDDVQASDLLRGFSQDGLRLDVTPRLAEAMACHRTGIWFRSMVTLARRFDGLRGIGPGWVNACRIGGRACLAAGADPAGGDRDGE